MNTKQWVLFNYLTETIGPLGSPAARKHHSECLSWGVDEDDKWCTYGEGSIKTIFGISTAQYRDFMTQIERGLLHASPSVRAAEYSIRARFARARLARLEILARKVRGILTAMEDSQRKHTDSYAAWRSVWNDIQEEITRRNDILCADLVDTFSDFDRSPKSAEKTRAGFSSFPCTWLDSTENGIEKTFQKEMLARTKDASDKLERIAAEKHAMQERWNALLREEDSLRSILAARTEKEFEA